MSPEQYKKLKEKEKNSVNSKKFGAFGPQSFQSRSLQSFQKDLELGKASHLMPVLNAKERIKKGEIREADIPYMQRMGSWDGSDIGKKRKWTDKDKEYANNAKNKASGMNYWTGSGTQQRKAAPEQPKKKLFGLF